jgi:dipeptidyl-peptidase-4
MRWATSIAAIALAPAALLAQDRLKTMPGYEQYLRMSREIPTAITPGALAASWVDEGKALEYTRDGRRYRFEIATRQTSELGPGVPAARGQGPPAPPARGRQVESATSPDHALRAFYRDRNMWLSSPDGSHELAITTDGSAQSRVKYGTGTWVYGEELEQRTAMWWSPDSRRIAYYRFDESQVPDYYLALNQTR